MWPDCVADFEGFDADEVCFTVVKLAMEVTNEDVEELVHNHSKELTIEELEHLQKDQ